MRSALLLSVLLAGCSLAGSDPVPFGMLVASSSPSPLGPITVVRSADAEATLRSQVGLAQPFGVDYGVQTVLVASTFGGCPSTGYDVVVLEVVDTGDGLEVEAEVTAAGFGGDAVTYPFQAVAVPLLDGVVVGDETETRVTLRLVGEAAQDCSLR